MKKKDLEKHVTKYLASWSGNNPEKVLKFFDKKAIFVDPANPSGISNKADLKAYLVPLLKKNCDWKWTVQELIPSKNGCIVKSEALIPLSKKKVKVTCVDILEFKDQKIIRNEIYFDRPKGYKTK